MNLKKIGSFLKRKKDSIKIQDSKEYKRITIKTKHQGVFLRDVCKGSLIGTKIQFKVKTDQFLLSKIDARLGAFGIVPDNLHDAIITGNFWTFDVDKSKVNIEWFNLFTSSGNFYEICDKASSGTTHRKYLDEKTFLDFEIALPTLKEQNDFLNKYREYKKSFDALSDELHHQQSYLQVLRQSILQQAVKGDLTKPDKNDEPASELLKRIEREKQKLIKEGKLKVEKELPSTTEDDIPFRLPDGWQWCRLNDIVDIRSGVTLGKTYTKEELHEVPYLRVANVQRGYIDIDHLKTIKVPASEIEKYKLNKGDLCMVEGGDWDKVGRCAIWEHDTNPCIHQNHIFRLRFYGGIAREWCEIYLNSPIARRYFENFSKQTTNLASINKTQLRSLLFALPPIEQQRRIVLKLRELQHQINLLEEQVAQSYQFAEKLLESLLKEAFSVKPDIVPFERKVLAGHIINMCYQDNYFGLTKFQKTLHVCEHHAQVEYDTNYEQEVAGPYDRAFTLAFKKEMIEEDWFQQETKVSLNRFVPGENVGKLVKEYPKYFRNRGDKIRFVLKLFQGKMLEESELIATLYAVWNNRIILNEPTGISYLIDDVYKWSERKAIYSAEEITAMHSWMTEKGLVPTGFGKEITKGTNN